MSLNFMSGIVPKWSSVVWLLFSNFLTLFILKFVAELSVNESDQLSATIAGQVPMTNESLTVILSIPFFIMLLISINILSEKNKNLYNLTVQSIINVLKLNKIWFYLSGLLGKFLALIVTLSINMFIFITFFYAFFSVVPNSMIFVFINLMLVLLSLTILYDLFFTTTYNVNFASSFTTITLVVMFIVNAMVRPFLVLKVDNLEWVPVLQVFILDLFMFVYLSISYSVTSILETSQYFSVILVVLMVTYICIGEWKKAI